MTDNSGVICQIKLFYNDHSSFKTEPSEPSEASQQINSINPHQTIIPMDEPVLLSGGNLVVVAKNPPGKPFHERGDAFILDPNQEEGVLCQFVLGRKKVVSPQRILREKNIDTVSRQRACDKVSRPSFLSTHHPSKRQTNATEKRDYLPIIRPVFQKFIESDCWEQKKDHINKHPILTYLRSGRQRECGWLRKDEATALNKKNKSLFRSRRTKFDD